jgi:outer membrane protein TolC
MSRQAPLFGVVVAAVLAGLAGCKPQEPFYLKNVDNDLAYYKGQATEIEYPDVNADRLPDVSEAKRPWSLKHRDTKNVWELTLEEAIQIALKNNKVMRNIGGQVQGPPDFITRNPEIAPTIYDPALAESDPRTGPEAALSAFDAQLQTSATWEKTDAPQNSGLIQTFPNVSEHDLGTFQVRLQKTAATGGTFALSQITAYDRDRFDKYGGYGGNQRLIYPADWNVKLVAEMRQPILQGAGVQFNRIAGPGATPGQFNGVMVARINTDIALANFEAGVRNLVSDVEVAYWELYFQYRSLDAVIAGRDSALETWRRIYTLYTNGSKGGEAEKEAQAREQYFLFRSTAEQSLNALYSTEAKMRYLLGLAATDGRLIRPKDEPTTAKVAFDWCEVLAEGLARSVELREQKWIVKRRELELIAAKNFLLPRVDLVGQYRWLGMGNKLDGDDLLDLDNVPAFPNAVPDSNAFRTLLGGGYQEWQMGVQGQINLGFRREMAGVRNAQLNVVKEQAKLQEGELELSHQLAYAVRDVETNHVLSQTNFNRRIAAERQVQAVQAAYETDTITLDVLLNAQQQLARAESDYFRSLVDYNKSIAQVHFRKGSLLEYNGVYLAEGPWPGKAYFDARRRSRARAASTPLDYGFTQPSVMSRGPIEQHAGGLSAEGGLPVLDKAPQGGTPTLAPTAPETVPAPKPEPLSSDSVPSEPVATEPSIVPTPARPQAEPRSGSTIATPTRATRRSSAVAAPSEDDGGPLVAPTERDSGATAAPTTPSADRQPDDGWKPTPNGAAAARRVDRNLLPAGWTVAQKGNSRESGQNPPSSATDWSASGWKRAQR